MEIIGHRGASHDAPENTVASAQLAWAQGADAVECDVQLSADEKLLVIHDATTKRTTGRRGKVSRMSFADLRQLDAGAWKGTAFAGEKPPTLGELIATIPPGKRLFIELKCGPAGIPDLQRSLADATPGQIVLIAFDYECLRAAAAALSHIPTLWIQSFRRRLPTGRPALSVAKMIDRCHAAGFAGLDLSSRWPIDAAFVRQVHAAHLQLYVWTVDKPAIARRLVAAGVDGIATNRPGWLRAELAAPPRPRRLLRRR